MKTRGTAGSRLLTTWLGHALLPVVPTNNNTLHAHLASFRCVCHSPFMSVPRPTGEGVPANDFQLRVRGGIHSRPGQFLVTTKAYAPDVTRNATPSAPSANPLEMPAAPATNAPLFQTTSLPSEIVTLEGDCSVAWRGVAWRGVAWRGVAWP